MDKPVSDINVYYTKGDGKIRKIKLKTLIRKLNKMVAKPYIERVKTKN